MAAITRIPRMSGLAGLGLCKEVFSGSGAKIVMCLNRGSESPAGCGGGERKLVVVKAAGCTPACVFVSEPKTDKGVNSWFLSTNILGTMLSPWMKFIKKHMAWKLNIQMILEKAIIDCRFFTLLAIAGSLVGSVLCFVEGCVLTMESYFRALSAISEQSHVVPILIEAIDMFLVGFAMFMFGMALHVMFVGQHSPNSKGTNMSSNFSLQKLRTWVGMESPMQAKSKIGHAVIMILQVQVLEKLKNVPMTNGIDLACFAGAVFLSSASIFILSRTVTARDS